MRNQKKLLLLLFVLFINLVTFAQTATTTGNDDKSGFMRSDGKIYVVMVVVLTILAGLIFYVSRLDRKISKLEKGRGS